MNLVGFVVLAEPKTAQPQSEFVAEAVVVGQQPVGHRLEAEVHMFDLVVVDLESRFTPPAHRRAMI